jgi:DHA2 family multidrug resistance protein
MLGQMSHVNPSADPTAGPAMALRMMYEMVQRQAAMLAYVDQFRTFGLLVVLIVPLVLLLRRPGFDPTAPAEAAH